ncbi:glycogen synthase GlgA [Parendozoicomonas haliclonae]|uniref:Glycogen synthase n=1 Tax=Parendozoicomonas haliclonae TaxID=1960125 RepID=A0A1X7AI17_9GAMM|nr:glycogen synthase GlgA [Parendozoicomonas haliclonae]SMA44039.1 Glycogen synthase [Parendozoicomonas haliclonae]
MASDLKILFAVSELAGIVKTGGLADVAAALGPWMRNKGHDVRVIMPAYRKALNILPTEVVGVGEVLMNGSPRGFAIRQGCFNGVPVYLIEHHHYFDREDLYTSYGEGFADNTERFAFFCLAALQACQVLGFQPDIIHGHDWPSALLPFYLKTHEQHNPFFRQTRSVLTIHNGAYQQHTDSSLLPLLGIEPHWFTSEHFEDHGRINLLKGGILFADKITTVSPHYAEELQTELGSHGLVQTIRRRADDFHGILNGCDYQEWNPETDPLLPANYSLDNLTGKQICKSFLQERAGLAARADIPLYGLVSRLTEQKGFAYLIPALRQFLQQDVQVVLQASGDPELAAELRRLAEAFPDKCRFVEAYDNSLAHQIEAGADFFLMPSLFEPCGLNQMYSMKYGTLPIVRAVGGLVDTVRGYSHQETPSEATGFVFDAPDSQVLNQCLQESLAIFHQPDVMKVLVTNAMQESFSWEQSTEDYLGVYRMALDRALEK